MKILFYCQHVLGIGHFFRSMEIAAALREHQVLFAGGGEPLPGFQSPRHVTMLRLPALRMDPEFKFMQSGGDDVDSVRRGRVAALLDACASFRPDVLLTELYPFGRRQFSFELIPLIEAAKKRSGPAAVVCSLRDILVEKHKPRYEQEVLDILNSVYDLLLIHSDPAFARLEETFTRAGEITIPVEYTGFVTRSPKTGDTVCPRPTLKEERTAAGEQVGQGDKKIIVASSGGGRVGADLLEAVILAVGQIDRSDLELRVFVGPFMDSADKHRLEQSVSSDSRVLLLAFSSDFQAELSRADLSVSMAGYNTCMDLLCSGTTAIVYPFPQNREQGMRAEKLERLGLVRVLDRLDPELLGTQIERALERKNARPAVRLNLGGAFYTAAAIGRLAPGTGKAAR